MTSIRPDLPTAPPASRGLDALLDALSCERPLPAGAGHWDLRGIEAAPDSLRLRLADLPGLPSWWDAQRQGLDLAEHDLSGALLSGADLTGANLNRAKLSRASARLARFDRAFVERADFTGADLGGSSFVAVIAGEACLANVMGEDADFTGASMRFARLPGASLDGATFDKADLWGAHFVGADADQTSFKGTRLEEADLSDVNLTGANFSGSSLKHARLVGSRLRGADFTGAALDSADLDGADLTDATLVRINLASCKLRHVRLAGAWLSETRMRVDQLGGSVGEEVAGDYAAARLAYQALERNFLSIGAKEDASWAYKKGRRMGCSHALVAARGAWTAGDYRNGLRHTYRWVADRFVEWLCDYGESMSRIARAFLLLIVVFAALYGASAGLIADNVPTRDPLDLVTYSALNMLTANPPDIGFKPVGRFTNALVGIQGAAGIVLMGLFGFVLGNRLRR